LLATQSELWIVTKGITEFRRTHLPGSQLRQEEVGARNVLKRFTLAKRQDVFAHELNPLPASRLLRRGAGDPVMRGIPDRVGVIRRRAGVAIAMNSRADRGGSLEGTVF
jgi:hypothetical protein